MHSSENGGNESKTRSSITPVIVKKANHDQNLTLNQKLNKADLIFQKRYYRAESQINGYNTYRTNGNNNHNVAFSPIGRNQNASSLMSPRRQRAHLVTKNEFMNNGKPHKENDRTQELIVRRSKVLATKSPGPKMCQNPKMVENLPTI